MSNDVDAILERYSAPIRDALGRQSDSIDKLAEAMAQMAKALAVSEEKHSNTADALARLGGRIDDHETRLRAVEAATAGNTFVSRNVGQFFWTTIAVTISLVLGYLFGGKQ